MSLPEISAIWRYTSQSVIHFLNSAVVISDLIGGGSTFVLAVTFLFFLACFNIAMQSPITVISIALKSSLVRSAASCILFVTKVAAYCADSAAGRDASFEEPSSPLCLRLRHVEMITLYLWMQVYGADGWLAYNERGGYLWYYN